MGPNFHAIVLLLILPISTASTTCKAGYIESKDGRNCYSTPVMAFTLGVINEDHWMKAADKCAAQQGYLIMPKNLADIDEIRGLLNTQKEANPSVFTTATGYFDIFAGVNNLDNGVWKWLDNDTMPVSYQFCSQPTEMQQCAMLRVHSGGFCLKPVLCDDQSWDSSYQFSTVLMCQTIISPIPTWCPADWTPRPNSDYCFHFSKSNQSTTWINAFCACHQKNAILSNLDTFEEAIWITGQAKKLELPLLLLGLTCLYPVQKWTWMDGTPLQSFNARFWHLNGGRNPTPPSGVLDPSVGNQCTGLSYLNGETSVMDPHLIQYDCVNGRTNYVCKMTQDTRKGVYPQVVVELANQLCGK